MEHADVSDDSPKLEIVLFANDFEVARSGNKVAWINAMAAISGIGGPLQAPAVQPARPATNGQFTGDGGGNELEPEGNLAQSFASDLGVSLAELEAAAGPSLDQPYIYLNAKYWEALKNKAGWAKTPPVVLAASILLLWNQHAKFGDVDLKSCGKILSDIGLTTKNANRAFGNCPWILVRPNKLILNPAMISKAEALVSTYCRGAAG